MSSAAKVELYGSMFCGYSARAKKLLMGKGVDFEETDVMAQPDQRPIMIERSGGRTSVPQIFINGKHIGGSSDLQALEDAGQLDSLLAQLA